MNLIEYIESETPFTCCYTNWKNETEERTLIPTQIRYGTNLPWHREPTWLLYAWDCKKACYKEFDMCKITNVNEFEGM